MHSSLPARSNEVVLGRMGLQTTHSHGMPTWDTTREEIITETSHGSIYLLSAGGCWSVRVSSGVPQTQSTVISSREQQTVVL